ncbi:hypothetical protein Tco_0608296 [Tanacetum coccineum]
MSSRRTESFSESEDSRGGHWKSRSKKQKSSIEEDDMSQPWVCEERDPFTSRIRYFDFPKKTRMPSNVKTYNESKDPEDHLKNFQAAAKVERCGNANLVFSCFNSTLTGYAKVWFDELPHGIRGYVPSGRWALLTRHGRKHFRHGNHRKLGENKISIEEETLGISRAEKDQLKTAKNGEASGKDKAMAILMVQLWQRVARQMVTQSFSPDLEILFLPLGGEDGAEGPMIIEAEIGGHFIHLIYCKNLDIITQ